MAEIPIKHDSNKDVVKGSLFLFLDGKPLAFEKTSTLNLSADAIDTSNKMCGDWAASSPGKRSFSISSEMLITKLEGAMSYDTLLQAFTEGKFLEFKFGEAKVTEKTNVGGKFEIDTTKQHYKGSVWINSLDLVSNSGELCTSSAAFTGAGALETVAGTGAPASALTVDGKSTK